MPLPLTLPLSRVKEEKRNSALGWEKKDVTTTVRARHYDENDWWKGGRGEDDNENQIRES
jgi:hypothetical protein